ncbi:unnamed protein product [Pleuronectes platessa]|uniref:Uncharacterized protein n=1 Tax=Pleuronectes platessa TaxID=8262 RepID=A0A9N7V4R1_PLEPL|nr:unnamed protein product [Pleuronectes platessa]
MATRREATHKPLKPKVQKQRKTGLRAPCPWKQPLDLQLKPSPKGRRPCQLYLCLENNSSGSHIVFPVAIRSCQAEKIDSTPKRSLHGARQPRHNATLQPPVCSALRFNMGVDGSQRIGAALTPRFGVASASGVNPALERQLVQRRRNWKVLLRMR